MDIFQAIKKRHSYREEFADKEVRREDLEKIVEAGCLAPSGCNAQTTSFVVVTDPDIVSKIQVIHPQIAWASAKAYIVCTIAKNPESVYMGLSFEVEDCAAAVENMLLAITALGYASVWVDGALRSEEKAQKIAALVDLPNDRQIRIVLPVGVPAKQLFQPQKKSLAERVKFI